MKARRLRLAVALLASGIVLHGSAARSQTAQADGEDPRIGQAFEACQTGQVQRGIDLLAQLYAQTQDPDFVTAQGLCFDKNGRPTEAARLYREFLRIAHDATAEQRANVERLLLQADERQARAKTAPASPTLVPQPPPPPAPALVTAESARAPQSKVVPLVLGGAGAAVLATGAFFWLQASDAVDDYKACHQICSTPEIDSRADKVKRLDLVAGIAAAVGTALAAAGVVVYLSGRRETAHASSSPPARTPASVTLRASFHSIALELSF